MPAFSDTFQRLKLSAVGWNWPVFARVGVSLVQVKRKKKAMKLSDQQRKRLGETVKARLELTPNLKFVLGEVILARIDRADDPTSYLVALLSQDLPEWRQQIETICAKFVVALVNRNDVKARVQDELIAYAHAPSKDFNNRLAGFIAEMAALGELPERYCAFVPIARTKGKTADYECKAGEETAGLEIKNINSPLGIFDVFQELLTQRKETSGYYRSISLKAQMRRRQHR